MAIKITFDKLNSSLQVGDKVYSIAATNIVDDNVNTSSSNFYNLIGIISNIIYSSNSIVIDTPANIPASNDYVFFAKNKSINESSLKGYYAKIELSHQSNSSTMKKVELFSIGSEIAVSSK